MAEDKNRGKVPAKRFGQGGLTEETCFNTAHLLNARTRHRNNKVCIIREIQTIVMNNENIRLSQGVIKQMEEMAKKYRIAREFLIFYRNQASPKTS